MEAGAQGAEDDEMGFLLCALLWGVVLLEEIERIPADEWEKERLRRVLLLRRTRTRPAFLLALALGAFFLYFELRMLLQGRSTFNPLQALGLAAVLFAAYLYAVNKKGRK